jgi:hypothetical protein
MVSISKRCTVQSSSQNVQRTERREKKRSLAPFPAVEDQ